jgi:hypothetical protein
VQGSEQTVLCAFFACVMWGSNGTVGEFFEQMVILNDAKHYMGGRTSTHNARKYCRGFHALYAGDAV